MPHSLQPGGRSGKGDDPASVDSDDGLFACRGVESRRHVERADGDAVDSRHLVGRYGWYGVRASGTSRPYRWYSSGLLTGTGRTGD
jgi:hypothetical protein